MTDSAKKRNLIVMRRAPYGSSLARASVDLALAMGAFDQDYDLLFMGAGALQLIRDQSSELLGAKNLGKNLSSLPLYDKEFVYLDAGALDRYGLHEKDLVIPVKLVKESELPAFISDCDHVLSC